MTITQNSPFTLQELTLAPESVNFSSAPGKDGITWSMLRNLDDEGRLQLFDELNTVGMSDDLIAE